MRVAALVFAGLLVFALVLVYFGGDEDTWRK